MAINFRLKKFAKQVICVDFSVPTNEQINIILYLINNSIEIQSNPIHINAK